MTLRPGTTLQLEYRAPFDFEALLGFFRGRRLEGIEAIGEGFYARTARIPTGDGTDALGWVRVEDDPANRALKVLMSDSLAPVAPQVTERLRSQFDTECDPHAVHEVIATLDETVPGAAVLGTRLPGAFDGFETAVRAILGQQVSLKAANRIAGRLVKTFGTPVETPYPELAFAFPTPAEVRRIHPVEEELGALGVIKSRSRSIAEVARLIEEGELDLRPGAAVSEQMDRLLAVKGIGPWTANYVAMRTLGFADAFLEADAGVAHALPDLSPKERAVLAKRWSPWRSYAVMSLWNSLG